MRINKKRNELGEVKMQMTSMIDIVFLLIIFFMCVTEMSKMEIEAVTLPEAFQARDDIGDSENRIIVNVMKNGTYRVMKKTYSRDRLKILLLARAAQMRDNKQLSNLAVKIRCDANASYKYVQQVMLICMEGKIWRLSFGVAQKNK
jgi:biopolymer transport protein ExbD